MGLENIVTFLNSGNILFDFLKEDTISLENKISKHLEMVFGFSIPTIVRKSEVIVELLTLDPFKGIPVTKDIRLYVSFLQHNDDSKVKLPWKSPDGAYEILEKIDKTVLSVLDLSISNTPKSMEVFEKFYGKDVTTRNWNTIVRIGKKLNP